MIQIIALRKFTDDSGKERTKQRLFGEYPTHQHIFENLDDVIKNIPEPERWNVYYTALDCKDRREVKALRRFAKQLVIPFDLDGINVERLKDYSRIFFETLSLEYADTVQVFSGNGLQFLVELHEPFTDTAYFDTWRGHYKFICTRINEALKAEGLPGNADSAVWTAARILRLPNTKNIKPKKGQKEAYLIQGNLKPQKFDWDKLADIPEVKESEHLAEWKTNQGKVDDKEIFDKCGFMAWTRDKPLEVREPHYYAALTIMARMDNGLGRATNLRDAISAAGSDSSVASYSDVQVEDKVAQALTLTGPRTCKNIESTWSGCKSCPLRSRITSPILIKSKEFIASEESGFVYIGPKGGVTFKFGDLIRYMKRELHFKTLDKNGLVYVWKDNHYQNFTPTQLKNYASEHFKADCPAKIENEFKQRVETKNLVPGEFFTQNINGKLNCANGILDLKKGTLEPHSSEYGFRYILPYSYDPSATAPRWEKFIEEIMDKDEERIKILQEFAGYAISGDEYKHHKFLMLQGGGRNGKGTFVEMLMRLAGGFNKNVSTVGFREMGDVNNRQLLEGKLFNFADETNVSDFKNTGMLKKMTGDGTMLVKMMYNQPYEIANRSKLIFACNALPNLSDTSVAIKERMLLVSFDKSFTQAKGNQDIDLKKKLTEELSGILNWCIEGYRRLEDQGRFSVSRVAQDEMLDYFVSNNVVQQWIEETGSLKIKPLNGKSTWISTNDAFNIFCEWGYGKGRDYEISLQKFAKELNALVSDSRYRRAKKSLKGGQQRGYYDCALEGKTWGVDWGQQGALIAKDSNSCPADSNSKYAVLEKPSETNGFV